MEILYKRELQILKQAEETLARGQVQGACTPEEYGALVNEYRKLLRQAQRVTRMSDKTNNSLNANRQELWNQANFDGLTGIYNRRFLDRKLEHLGRELAHSGASLSLLMLDVDYFKKYNDTYGHGAGDQCLHAIAQVLPHCIRKSGDFAARYGGEEFLLCLPHAGIWSGAKVARRVRSGVHQLRIPHELNTAAGAEQCVTVSIGVASGRVERADLLPSYIKLADQALYQSKQNGRNRITFLSFQKEVASQ